jgi:hypothetical protein
MLNQGPIWTACFRVPQAGGLVRSQKIGRIGTCSLNPPGRRSAESGIAERRSLWERSLDRLGD